LGSVQKFSDNLDKTQDFQEELFIPLKTTFSRRVWAMKQISVKEFEYFGKQKADEAIKRRAAS